MCIEVVRAVFMFLMLVVMGMMLVVSVALILHGMGIIDIEKLFDDFMKKIYIPIVNPVIKPNWGITLIGFTIIVFWLLFFYGIVSIML